MNLWLVVLDTLEPVAGVSHNTDVLVICEII